jgi:hypothetical protein
MSIIGSPRAMHASTGPRSGDRGELNMSTWSQAKRWLLQRGRGPETAESLVRFSPVVRPICFNGAAVRRPRRVDSFYNSATRNGELQRGRGPETAERG